MAAEVIPLTAARPGDVAVIEVRLTSDPLPAPAAVHDAGPLLYRVKEAARQLGIAETKLRQLEARGLVRFLRIDGATVVDRDELVRFRDRLREEQWGDSP